jgi:hypothetical protein
MFIKRIKAILSNHRAIALVEGITEAKSEAEYYAAWQHIIDQGLHRTLQGWYGRSAQVLIEEGICKE